MHDKREQQREQRVVGHAERGGEVIELTEHDLHRLRFAVNARCRDILIERAAS